MKKPKWWKLYYRNRKTPDGRRVFQLGWGIRPPSRAYLEGMISQRDGIISGLTGHLDYGRHGDEVATSEGLPKPLARGRDDPSPASYQSDRDIAEEYGQSLAGWLGDVDSGPD